MTAINSEGNVNICARINGKHPENVDIFHRTTAKLAAGGTTLDVKASLYYDLSGGDHKYQYKCQPFIQHVCYMCVTAN